MLSTYFADMHIHIGRDIYNQPVKITASKNLTIQAILEESSRNKGIHLIGVIDCQSPAVQQEITQLIETNKAMELEDGGIRFESVTLILGSEIEIYDEHCHGPIHVLCYLPTLAQMQAFSEWLCKRMKNITLSSQRYYGSGIELQRKVKELGGVFIPAHVFTPFKSLYGKGVYNTLKEVFDPRFIDGIELGLSSDSQMADQIQELHDFTYLSNSDSHSLSKIAREYQEISMKFPSFREFYLALHRLKGRQVTRNYGMNPRLGKYHTTVCSTCFNKVTSKSTTCPFCGDTKIIKGVVNRIDELKDIKNSYDSRKNRPPYVYQVPLEYLPKLGKKTYEKLLRNFGTEMNVIHHAPLEELKKVIPEQVASSIVEMRNGKQRIETGGGGRYGFIK
ncbi:endonuclease Q family protein [Virgibacillus salexigens]|uniref:endonuclease Q family protein n=1 Tax=Virgibacillus massiliensis TaxID=1462526 RepID=UPI00301CCA53